MVLIFNWFLAFVQQFINMLINMVSADGYSFGYMLLAIAVLSVIIGGTIYLIAIAGNTLGRRK